eukprot:4934541-Amphidinium_carterae.1
MTLCNFASHTRPQVTSVDWHPTDETVLAVACADDSVSLWDMAVEDSVLYWGLNLVIQDIHTGEVRGSILDAKGLAMFCHNSTAQDDAQSFAVASACAYGGGIASAVRSCCTPHFVDFSA